MELGEAIKELESLSPSENAIKTVLQALEKLKQDNYKLDKENQKLFEININSVPKKKIEEKIELRNNIKNSYKKIIRKIGEKGTKNFI